MQCHCASVYRCLARSITIAIFELSPAIETPCRQNYKFVGRIAAKMRPIPVHVSRSVVCGFPSVLGTPVNLAETAELIEMQFGADSCSTCDWGIQNVLRIALLKFNQLLSCRWPNYSSKFMKTHLTLFRLILQHFCWQINRRTRVKTLPCQPVTGIIRHTEATIITIITHLANA